MTQYYPDLKIQEILTRDFWGRLRRLFVKERNVTFDRYEAFTRKPEKTESLEEFNCGLTELVVKGNFKCTACKDGEFESEITRDLFTANMSNDEVLKDILAETKSSEQALDHTGFTNKKSEPVNFVQRRSGYKSQPRVGRNREGMTSRNSTDRSSQNTDCFKCGSAFSMNHLAQCPARDKICNKCSKRGSFC